MVGCDASSEHGPGDDFNCEGAFDGVAINSASNVWASQQEGVGAWIRAQFDKVYNTAVSVY